MSRLITKGKDELKAVYHLIKEFEEDNEIAHLQLAGYELQRVTEFFVKDSILLLGEPYKESGMRPNLQFLSELIRSNRHLPQLLIQKFEHPLSMINNEYIGKLDDWEAKGRYDPDLEIDLEIIKKILPLAEELQEAASELDKGGSAS